MAVKNAEKELAFEDALGKLEENVKLLEGGELSLEDALKVFKEGVELSHVCLSKINTVQQEVQKVTAVGSDGYAITKISGDEE